MKNSNYSSEQREKDNMSKIKTRDTGRKDREFRLLLRVLYFILKPGAWKSGKPSRYTDTKNMIQFLLKGLEANIQLSTPDNQINVLPVVFPRNYDIWLFREVRKPKAKF